MKKRLKILCEKIILLTLAITVAATPIVQSVPVEAANDSIWGKNGELQLHLEGEAIPDHLYGLGDIPCDMRQIPLTYRGKDQIRNECLVDTEYGSLKSAIWSYFMPHNASKLGLLDMGNASWLLPVPNQEKVILMTKANAPSDSRVIHVYDSYEDLIKKSHATNGYHDTYRLSRSHDNSINKTDGSHVAFRYSQIGFSRNGKWMIARVGATIIRVNLVTLEVLAGASSGTSASGNFDLAISNDGGYGAIGNTTSYPSPNAKIIDFTTCSEPNQNNNLEIVDGCGERDLGQDLVSLGVDEKGAQKIEFSNDGTMLSMNVKIDGQYSRATVSAPGYEYSGLDCLALGDSFASGEGDLESEKYYLEGTDVSPNAQFLDGESAT